MLVLTSEQIARMHRNGQFDKYFKDHYPVVKLLDPKTDTVWLFSELHPTHSNIAYGITYSGDSDPLLCWVDLNRFIDERHPRYTKVIADRRFKAQHGLTYYFYLAARRLSDMQEEE